jgi:hypothetical protein
MLLHRFAQDGLVQLVSREDLKRTHKCSVNDALKIKHFYTVELDDGSRSTAMENPALSTLDGEASAAIRQLIDEGQFPPPPRARAVLSQFLAMQLLRGEGARATLAQFHAEVAELDIELGLELARQATMENRPPQDPSVRQLLRTVHSDFVEEHQREPTPEEVRAELRDLKRFDGRWDTTNPAAMHITTLFPSAEQVASFLERRVWVLLTFAEPCLLTGDEPVAMIGNPPTALGRPLGVGNAAEVVFATDPRHALVLVRPDKADRDRSSEGTQAMARIINRAVAYRCYRWIVHHPAQTPLAGMNLPKPGLRATRRGPYVAMFLSPVRASRVPRLARNRRGKRG